MYTKDSPFLSKILERRPLCSPHSEKQTYHLSLDLAGSALSYRTGDSIGIWPENSEDEVREVLRLSGMDGSVPVQKKEYKGTLHNFLKTKANLDTVSRKLFAFIVSKGAKQ